MFLKLYLSGRQGNQMFQLAYCLILGQKYKNKILTIPCPQFGNCLGLFSLPIIKTPFFNNLFDALLRKILGLLPVEGRLLSNSCLKLNHFPEVNSSLEVKGYFQDGMSFMSHREYLRKIFKIKPAFDEIFRHKYQEFFKEKVFVLNLRFGNYRHTFFQEINSNGLLPTSWYEEALKTAGVEPENRIFVISDEIEAAKKEIDLSHFNVFFIDDTPENHFQFLMHADILIISNSSFSWWGAFLNDKPEKKVYAPKNWVGFNVGIEYPAGIMIDDFIWI